MAEAIRLVVWDLDGTFWAGTVTEGGHTYNDVNHNIVVELARRGIVSSICSKNDYETVKAILEERGIWEYFVFPSINWNPKGPRLKQMIEDVQLRPETVLLLDDNSLNLNEAKHFVPGIQTADESFIPQMLESPLLKGKDDRELSRLKQYRLLESRKADEAGATDNAEFLRSCNITVTIDRNVEANLDRAIELINRTNQLNFTKLRLPEDMDAARQMLSELLKSFKIQAGLIRVTDKYGDYGYCGLYITKTPRIGKSRLVQFCFSCRILNMGVEHWVYQRLGRPELKVAGEVLSDLSAEMQVDWINMQPSGGTEKGDTVPSIWPGRVIIRGACNVSALTHYFQIGAREVIGEFFDVRGFVNVRRDHSLILQYGIEGCTPEQWSMLCQLGYEKADLETRFATVSNEPTIRVLANWADCQDLVYRHEESGFLIPYMLKRSRKARGRFDKLAVNEGDYDLDTAPEEIREMMSCLRHNYKFVGRVPEDAMARALDTIFAALPAGSPLFIIAVPEDMPSRSWTTADAAEANARVDRAMLRHPEKTIFKISMEEFVSDSARDSAQHFSREVYFRLYERIWSDFRAAIAAPSNDDADVSVNIEKPQRPSLVNRMLGRRAAV